MRFPGWSLALAVSFLTAFVVTGPIPPAHAGFDYPADLPVTFLQAPPGGRGQLLVSWIPQRLPPGAWDLGMGWAYLVDEEDSGDVDTLLSLGVSRGISRGMTLGAVLPFIARDPDLNYSGLLDLQLFARYPLSSPASPWQASVEGRLVLPTAADTEFVSSPGGTGAFPYSLGTPALRLGASLARREGAWSGGFNGAYQAYLESEQGSDADVAAGMFLTRTVHPGWEVAAEAQGMTHLHSGDPGSESLTTGSFHLGAFWEPRPGLRLGLGLGQGLFDTPFGMEARASLTASLSPSRGGAPSPSGEGATRPSPAEGDSSGAPPPPRLPPGIDFTSSKPGKGGVLMGVVNRTGRKGASEEAAGILRRMGYAVVFVDDLGGTAQEGSRLYARPDRVGQAEEIGRALAPRILPPPVPYPLKNLDVLLVLGR